MRYLVAILACLVVLGTLGAVKGAQIGALMSAGKSAKASGPPPESVGTAVAKEDVWHDTLSDVGTVASAKGVTVSNDSPGVVTRIHFDSGQEVKRGQLLVELETDIERAQLAASEAKQELAHDNLRRSSRLDATGAIPRSQLDNDKRGFDTSRQESGALRAQISHKLIRAPFDGRLGIRAVNLGQYLAPGTAITVLETTNELYVDFSMPQERLPELALGMQVRITLGSDAADAGAPRDGVIAAVEPSVDVGTRMARIRATAPNGDGALRSGMFVRATVILPREQKVVLVPVPALVHASFGDSVFLVEDRPDGKPAPGKVARQQFVRTGEERGDFIAIADGVKPGAEVVVAGGFKLRNGAPVAVDNKIQSKPELEPHPQNR